MTEPKIQRSKTESAHVGDRGKSQMCPDWEAIPLCGPTDPSDGPVEGHHREGPTSQHKLGKKFWEYWQIDRDTLIAVLNSKYEQETGRGVGRGESVLEAREVCA